MNELPLYQIRNWSKTFENNRSRTNDNCRFVCVPNKHGGSGLANVQGEPNGATIYGIWSWILQLCSRQPTPRQGYLTANGGRDGRRFSVAELARLFRRPQAEIQMTLRVLSSGEVEWLELLEGEPECHLSVTNSSLEGQSAVTPASLEGQSAVIPASLEGQSPVTEASIKGQALPFTDVTEGRKEGRNFSLSGENEAKKNVINSSVIGHSSGSEASLKGQALPGTDVTSASLQGQAAVSDVIQHTEAKRLFGKLCQDVFGEPRYETQWPDDENHWLDKALPMKREHWDLIDWFYRLPADHEIFKVTRRRQSMRMLMENVRSEPQKIRSARQIIRLNGLESSDVTSDNGWTPARISAALEIFPEATFPEDFENLDSDLRGQIDRRVTEKAK